MATRVVNAAMGRGMGGGMAGMMAQTALGGQEARRKALQAHQAQRLGLMEDQTKRLFDEGTQRRDIGSRMQEDEIQRWFDREGEREQRGVELMEGEEQRRDRQRLVEYKTNIDMQMSMFEGMLEEALQRGDQEAAERLQNLINQGLERITYLEGVLGASPDTLRYLGSEGLADLAGGMNIGMEGEQAEDDLARRNQQADEWLEWLGDRYQP